MSRRGADPASRARIAVLAGVVLSLFAAAAVRAAYLQIVQAPQLRIRAEDQRTRRLKLLPARGTIYDRNRRELAVSVPGGSVFVDPTELLRVPEGLERLCGVLGLAEDRARRDLERGGSRFAWVKRRISPAEEEGIRALRLPGVGVAREAHRFYPKKSLAGQVLGFVGLEEEGLGGLEFQFEASLRGREAWVRAERDARGTLLLADAPGPTEGRGRGLILTLDETIQHIAEEELAAAVEKSAAKGGWVVILEPSTGEILALAQSPGFNPNAVARSRAEERKLRATTDVYEPGSTFKALFLGVLLDRQIVRPTDMVFCENGTWVVNRQRIHDHSPHGWLSVEEVLKVSSNIGVAKLSERIAASDFYEGLQAFGVGKLTEVELPGESRGILPHPRSWWKSTAKTVAFGQGVSATALQVASGLAAIANGGVRMKPRIILSELDELGREARHTSPEPMGRALSSEAAATLTRMMELVVHGEGGTGNQAAIPGYTVAGKTGTAWKPDPNGRGYQRDAIVASFMGFVPSRAPRLAALVALDEPRKGSRYGGTTAAPAFAEIGRQVLAYLQVPPTEAAAVAETVPKKRPAGAASRLEDLPMPGPAASAEEGVMPDVRGLTMREALRRIESTRVGVRLSLSGSGVATGQIPSPGASLEAGNTCRIEFHPLL